MIRLLAVALLTFASVTFAKAPESVDPALAPWFHGLKNQISGISCCDMADGHILADSDWRAGPDGYEVRIAEKWFALTPDRVLNGVSNPTGRAVLFYGAGAAEVGLAEIYCFVRPSEG